MKIQGLNAEKKPLQNSKQYVYIVHYLAYLIFLDSNLKVTFFIIILNDTQMKTWCDFFVYFRRNNTNRLSRKSESQELKDSGKYWNRKEEDPQFPSGTFERVGRSSWMKKKKPRNRAGRVGKFSKAGRNLQANSLIRYETLTDYNPSTEILARL